MTSVLADNPLLTLFLVMAAGAAVGAIRLGPVRLGAAGALFVGLALSAANPDLSEGFTVVQQVGLALFVYTVGIASGATFVSSLKTNAPLIFGAGLASVAGALVAGLAGAALGFSPALSTGVFTGALTAAPALDAASRLSGDPQAAVGYATAYPVGVLVGISAMSGIIGGGGLGKIAIDYGYYRYKYLVMLVAVILLVLLVQVLQTIGTKLAIHSDKRLKK